MTPWLPHEEPLYHECNTKEDVVFGMRRFRFVLDYYRDVYGAAAVWQRSPQQADDETGKPFLLTPGELHDDD